LISGASTHETCGTIDGMDDGPLQQILSRRGRFGHREHLELAWTCLDGHPSHEAGHLVANSLRHLAATHGNRDACRAPSFVAADPSPQQGRIGSDAARASWIAPDLRALPQRAG
jgi:hypothetical protein